MNEIEIIGAFSDQIKVYVLYLNKRCGKNPGRKRERERERERERDVHTYIVNYTNTYRAIEIQEASYKRFVLWSVHFFTWKWGAQKF